MDLHEIAQALMTGAPAARIRYGVVEAVNATTVDLTLAASLAIIPGVRYLDTYAPTFNDTVVVVVTDGDLFVLGRLA